MNNKANVNQKAGGYSFIVEKAINGQAEVLGYDDFKPPVFVGELTQQQGSGFYPDLNQPNIGGQMVFSGYDDNNPPVFIQSGGKKLLDKKIEHLTNYIISKGNYKLPKYILNDLNKLNN